MRQVLFKVLTIASLIVLLTSCGQGNQPDRTRKVTPQPTQGISFDIANFHIFSAAGLHCTHHPPYPLNVDHQPGYPQGNLVLATTRTTYDSVELQQMTTYVATLFDLTNLSLKAPPNVFKWASGSTVGDDNYAYISGCYVALEITNVGKTSIQIQSMDIRLTANPRQNRSQYRLIDDCSLVPLQVCKPGGSGGGVPTLYHFQLIEGKIGQMFSPQPPTSPEITLNPSDITEVYATFDSSPVNLIYSIMPDLVLDTSSGLQIISLPQLAGTIYFADVNEFSCYTLKGDTFVLLEAKLYSASNFCI